MEEPRIVSKGAFTLIGLEYGGKKREPRDSPIMGQALAKIR